MAMDEPYEVRSRGQDTGVVELAIDWTLTETPYLGQNGHMPSPDVCVELELANSQSCYVVRRSLHKGAKKTLVGELELRLPDGTVLATGGYGKAWKVTSNSWEYTGDGHALAYEAGAELIDMEFFQFHPTGMIWPPGVMGILVTEGVRGEGGVLTNSKGERFMLTPGPSRI